MYLIYCIVSNIPCEHKSFLQRIYTFPNIDLAAKFPIEKQP
jgi:hypothetical protein